jgi:predicted dithiol-disulfide oxidoreductase (DUF899 family)
MKTKSTAKPKVVTPKAWLAARLRLLKEEKKFTRLQDKINERRRALPWVKVDKDYIFTSSRGKASLRDLFGPHSQLIVQHFMFGPGWEQGCKSCSFMMDHFAPTVPHLAARDVAFAAISHAPIKEILPFKKRMGWNVNWVSAHDTDFNHNFHVSFTEEEIAAGKMEYNYTVMDFPQSEAPGISVFARDDAGTIYHTYSTYGRGVEVIMGTYRLLDMVPKGRDEAEDEYGMEWLRHHDNYQHASAAR